jgi:hypothetical protein
MSEEQNSRIAVLEAQLGDEYRRNSELTEEFLRVCHELCEWQIKHSDLWAELVRLNESRGDGKAVVESTPSGKSAALVKDFAKSQPVKMRRKPGRTNPNGGSHD